MPVKAICLAQGVIHMRAFRYLAGIGVASKRYWLVFRGFPTLATGDCPGKWPLRSVAMPANNNKHKDSEVKVLPSPLSRLRPYCRKVSLYCLTLGLLAASASSWAVSMSQQYQQLRSQANLVSAMALLHFDTDPRPGGSPEKEPSQGLNEAGVSLRQQADRLGLSSPHLQGMFGSVEALKQVPAHQEVDYAALLIELLDHHERLDDQLSALYRAYNAAPVAQAMNLQSQRIAALRLGALMRNARVLGRHTLSLGENTFARLDQEIEGGFEALHGLLPEAEQAELLRKHQVYRFVRKQLLTPDTLRKSVAVERYVNGLVGWFDEQAARLDVQARQAGLR